MVPPLRFTVPTAPELTPSSSPGAALPTITEPLPETFNTPVPPSPTHNWFGEVSVPPLTDTVPWELANEPIVVKVPELVPPIMVPPVMTRLPVPLRPTTNHWPDVMLPPDWFTVPSPPAPIQNSPGA